MGMKQRKKPLHQDWVFTNYRGKWDAMINLPAFLIESYSIFETREEAEAWARKVEDALRSAGLMK